VTPPTQTVELLSTAYVFLRAVLKYPKMFGERLVKDVERWGRWVTDRLRKDPDVKGLYDKETIGGGTGGRPRKDGVSGAYVYKTYTLNTPMEVAEKT
jgi:Adenine-specific DNA methylase containing a Zn-ribbon